MYKLTQAGKYIIRIADNAQIAVNDESRDYLDYKKWADAGNVATPADPAQIPIDYSDSDNIDKTLKALLLCIAQVGGLTIPQAKTLFKSKFNALP